jgi:EPS-associated MarR family transcriptional regulator
MHKPPRPPVQSRQSQLQENTYYQVMHILRDSPDVTQRELAARLGVSVGGLNYCLKALINKGWVKMQNFSSSKNKFGYVYILTAKGIAEKAALTSSFLKRKLVEYDALKAEIESLKAELGAAGTFHADSSPTVAPGPT